MTPPRDPTTDDVEVSHRAPSERTDRGQNGDEPTGLGWLERFACSVVRMGPMPRHVAFIMDGNRRFARERGWQIQRGHELGYGKLEEALRWCCELGVRGVTVYAFSIENFKRSSEEVDALMALCEEKLRAMCDEAHVVQRNGVRVRVVGDLSRVSPSLQAEMRRVMRMTQGNTRHTLNVCFSYTSRNEIASAVQRLSGACSEGKLLPYDISEVRPVQLARACGRALRLGLAVRLAHGLGHGLTLTFARTRSCSSAACSLPLRAPSPSI